MNAGASGAAQSWANGYQSWSHAKDAFDKWAALTAKGLAEVRGVKVAEK